MPEKLYEVISMEEEIGEEILEENTVEEELNFRRALKARAMSLGKPLQLIRQVNLDETKTAGQQDDATKAWNFCTALYYKSGPTIPWKLEKETSHASSCAVGIAFYRSRDRETLRTSLAQIFDELGNGLILRGTPVEIDKDDRVPRLTSQQSYDLIGAALNEYRIALRNFPARVVVHKSSNFTGDEIDGVEAVARELHIHAVDFVTVLDSNLRLFRDGNYPPFRGTLARIEDNSFGTACSISTALMSLQKLYRDVLLARFVEFGQIWRAQQHSNLGSRFDTALTVASYGSRLFPAASAFATASIGSLRERRTSGRLGRLRSLGVTKNLPRRRRGAGASHLAIGFPGHVRTLRS